MLQQELFSYCNKLDIEKPDFHNIYNGVRLKGKRTLTRFRKLKPFFRKRAGLDQQHLMNNDARAESGRK